MKSNNNILSTSKLSIGYASKKERIVIAENLNLNLEKGKLDNIEADKRFTERLAKIIGIKPDNGKPKKD